MSSSSSQPFLLQADTAKLDLHQPVLFINSGMLVYVLVSCYIFDSASRNNHRLVCVLVVPKFRTASVSTSASVVVPLSGCSAI